MTRKRARITEANNPLTSTDEVLEGFQRLADLTSQEVETSTIQLDKKLASQQVEMPALQQPDLIKSEEYDKSAIQKATFQLSQSVLNDLDRCHLKLQLELGKKNTPYKEVIVEEAIAELLVRIINNQDEVINRLKERQKQRK